MSGEQLRMALCVATMVESEEFPGDMGGWLEHANCVGYRVRRNTPEDNLGVVGSYDWLYRNTDAELLAYLHDDVICSEPGWDDRVLREFEDPSVGVVGFGGGRNHGTDELYKRPYRIQQLVRSDYLSNTDDAEVHGSRFSGAADVAVLDGFALIVRRSLLDRAGGWPVNHIRFHNYDLWLCAMAHRLGFRVRVLGARCHHRGGQTSTTVDYQEWAKKQNMTDAEDHAKAHEWFYEEFRDVMPWVCERKSGGVESK